MKKGCVFLLCLLPGLVLAQNIVVNGPPVEYPAGVRGAVELEFQTAAGIWYQVEISPSMAAGLWDDEGYSIEGTGGMVSTIVSTRGWDKAFYRIRDDGDPANSGPWPVYVGLAPINVNASYEIGINTATEGYILNSTKFGWVASPPNPTPASILTNMQPYTSVNFIIALTGFFPSRSSDDPFIGEIIMFGGNFAPRGWALCDGQLLAISQNPSLFSILGTTFGGDGRTTFGLPELRGRAPIHPGTGVGLTNRRLGQNGGSEDTTHNHN